MCWRLGAEKPGVLSEEEWARFGTCPALPTYGDATLETLKSGWGSLDPAFLDNSEFRPFFKFCFEFNRDGTKKFLERDTALARPSRATRNPHLSCREWRLGRRSYVRYISRVRYTREVRSTPSIEISECPILETRGATRKCSSLAFIPTRGDCRTRA